LSGGSPDAKVGTAKHENILIDEFALFQPLFSSQEVKGNRQEIIFIYSPHHLITPLPHSIAPI
jgi:hypothetical protein